MSNSRFEIRKLEPEHVDWARAILSLSNIFHSPAWSKIYHENKTERLYYAYNASEYLVRHQIESGWSYGVFDREYEFKQPSSSISSHGGALYWDRNDKTATSADLLAQMDFPLVSIALALDAAEPLDPARVASLAETLPFYARLMQRVDELDDGSKRERRPVTGPRQVMLRNGTSTRPDYEGLGLMKKAAHLLMRDAAEAGFRAISIETLSDAVQHVWMNPPEPYRAVLVVQVRISECEEKEAVDVDGEKKSVVLHPDVPQIATRIQVDLK
ncbi:hypothetical protein UA08_02773 [Talaromyces atroroseus]|uniref:N-acetyltransferase domain-containing protein n=1 Tax=Talaromyces atroroseus TaxID=1441469 RepID=A0A225AJJ0_TALAT|nr:hypothetical protein UA08_02773 [Talaromyces atroroseus]OKL61671.1 hypothetical protein UA08_02773 [Talaromyces atroroseus]